MRFQTLNECIRYAAGRHIKDDAFLELHGNNELRPISMRDFYYRARFISLGLNDLGIAKGDRVAILSENRYEWMLADIAILGAGAISVPLYVSTTREHLFFILKDSGAKAIVASRKALLERIVPLKNFLPDLQHIIAFDYAHRPKPEEAVEEIYIPHLHEFAEKGARIWKTNPDLARNLLESVKGSDLATIVYTSGTTGEPKGVMLTHENLASNIQSCANLLEVTARDRAISFLPLCHIFERMVDYVYFFKGVSIAHVPDLKYVKTCLDLANPTVFAAVPRFYEKLYGEIFAQTQKNFIKRAVTSFCFAIGEKYSDARLNGKKPSLILLIAYKIANLLVFSRIRRAVAPALKFTISGGAPLNPRIGKFFYSIGITILEGYGLTETSPVVSLTFPHKIRYGWVGNIITGTEVKIDDDGEILVRGPNVMKGYWNLPNETAEVFVDGWFRTGDLGEMDDEGFLKITGRKKEIIVTAGGKNIAPSAIEERLTQSKYIEQAMVIGDKRKFLSALIVPNAEALHKEGVQAITSQKAHSIVKKEIEGLLVGFEGYERVIKFALLDKSFSIEDGTLTPTLKVRRKVVGEKYKDIIEGLYG